MGPSSWVRFEGRLVRTSDHTDMDPHVVDIEQILWLSSRLMIQYMASVRGLIDCYPTYFSTGEYLV